ncbi:unnamed protein product [Closterium sp. NIES-65]|nr:unnamed protein product [Closterium sp. NIES-65]CAI5944071.1 unnamed protein product [Closterium sp. NIES-65]CAI5944094.1 unnamed protein product [Closterium sp. NIES-65]CAI5953003.1 unnamed protein product [Closterium sp. NIES-65]CAI5957650.1 unnamed protein product [Closterium sp. NIES-65]
MVVGLPDSDGRLKKERSAGSNLRTMSPPIQRAADGKPQRRRGKKHLALPAPGPQQGEPARLVPVGEVQRDSPPLKDPEALSLTVYVGAPASRRKGKRSAKALDLEETPTKKQRPEEGPGQTSAVPQQPLDLPTGYVPNVVIVHPPGHDNQQQLEVRGRKQKKRKAAAEAKTLTETDYPPPPKIVFFEPVLNTVEPSSEPEKAIQNPFDGSGTHLGKPAPEFPGFKAGEQGVPTVSGDSLNTSNLSSVVAKCKGCHHVFWGQKIRKIRKRHRCPPARPDSAKPREALRTSPEPKAQGSLPVLEGDQTAPEAAPQAKAGPEEVLGDDSQQHPLSGAAGQRGTPVPHSDNPAHPAEAGPDVDMRTLPVDDRNSSQSHREPLPDTQGRDSFDRLIDMMIALSEKVQTMSNQLEEVRRSVSAGEREVAKPATENLGAIPDIPTASEAASAAQSPSLPPTKGVDSGHKTKGKKPKQKKKKKKPKPRASPSPSTATAPAAPAVPTSTPKPSGEASPPAVALVPKSPGPRPKGRAAWGELGPRDKSQAVTRKAGAAKPPTFAASSSEDASAPTKASKDPSAAPAKSDSSAISHGGQAKLPKGHRCTFCSRLFRSRKEVEDHAKRKNGCANRDAQREDQLRDRKRTVSSTPEGCAAVADEAEYWANFEAIDWSPILGEEAAMLPTLRKVPFKCRGLATACLRPILEKLRQDGDHKPAGTLLGLFPQLCLSTAALSNDSPHWKQVRELLTLWRRGDWTKLHLRALAAINKMNSRVRENKARVDDRYGSADTLARTRRCIKFGELAELSRAAEALIAADLAPTTDETRKSLEEKHPRPTVPFTAEDGSCTLPHPEKPTKWVLKQEVLARALRESPRGSAGGPTGWRMDFLRELFTHPGDLKLLGAWLQAAARGDVGQGVAQWWTSSSLVALEKPGGGVRPIAVGEVFPRLLARCLAVDYHDAIIRHLKPKGQFGAGARNGAETVIHGVRAALKANPTWGVLQIDVKNAFNSVCRQALFKELVKGPFVGMTPFLRTLYGSPSPLLYRADATRHTLWSRTGVRQGDPLGPFLYALAQQPALEAVKAAHRDVFLCSYADDTYLLGELDAIGAAFPSLCKELQGIDLEVSQKKCQWYAPSGKRPSADNPLCEMTEAAEGLVILNDDSLLNPGKVNKAAQTQITLPERMGGFGVQSAARTADLAYVVSLLSVAGTLKSFFQMGGKSILGVEDSEAPFPPIFEEAESALKRLPEKVRTKLPTWKTVGERGLERGTFTVLARELQIEALNGIRKSLNRPRHKARLTSLQLQNAGAWVSALPSRPDLQLESDDWAIAANLRLGRDIPHLIQAGTCSCGKDLSTCNAAGHALRCSTKYAPSIPHNAIRDHVAMVCREAGMQTTMEDKAFFGGKPIPDVVSLHTDSGKTWVMDVVIADPHDNNANCPETKPGAALNEAVRRKKVTYKEAVTKGGKRMEKTTKVIPLATEIYGGWSNSFSDCVKDIAATTSKRLGRQSGQTTDLKSLICRSIAQRIGVTQQRSQAVMIRHRLRAAVEAKGETMYQDAGRTFDWMGSQPPAPCDIVVGRVDF